MLCSFPSSISVALCADRLGVGDALLIGWGRLHAACWSQTVMVTDNKSNAWLLYCLLSRILFVVVKRFCFGSLFYDATNITIFDLNLDKIIMFDYNL